MRTFIITFFSCFYTILSFAQQGCTDPLASNFSASATSNDGSCLYPATAFDLTQLTTLPNTLVESSGLAFFNNNLWTHNDGGNLDRIYRIDSLTGNILQEVIIATADNNDWEDMAENETHLFVGDFGNNPGNRMDLAIHRIEKNDLTSNIVNSEVINFSFSDQTSFPELPNDNNFDCEAFLIKDDVIHLFSKNWVDEKTRHYTLPNIPGTHIAQFQSEFDAQGLISGAAIDDQGNIVLIGYTPGGISFMWLLFDYQGDDVFSGNKRYISLGSAINTSQIEGVVFKSTGYGYISAERFATLEPKLFSFNINSLLSTLSTPTFDVELSSTIDIYPNPFSNQLDIQISNELNNFDSSELSIYNLFGKKIVTQQINNNSLTSINTSNFRSGFYLINIVGKDFSVSQKIIKR